MVLLERLSLRNKDKLYEQLTNVLDYPDIRYTIYNTITNAENNLIYNTFSDSCN